MRNILKCIISLAVMFALWPSIVINAATEDYPAKFHPKVEVRVNVGNTEFADSAFLEALIAALQTRGVGVSKIDVDYASTVKTDFSVTDPANWIKYDHLGWWDEIGGFTDLNAMFLDYLATHVTGWDDEIMGLDYADINMDTKKMFFSYFDGSDLQTIDFKDMSSLINRVNANILDFSVYGWVDSLVPGAETMIKESPEGSTLGFAFISNMWYESKDKTAYLTWADSSSYAFHTITFQAYEDYLSKSGFLASLDYSYTSFDNTECYLSYHDEMNDDYFSVYFSPTEFGAKDPDHYPSPDENPDGDNPVNWENDPHIVIHNNGQVVFYGYGAPAYKDFMLSVNDAVSDKHFAFDLDESKVDYHSMEGGGFLFSIALDKKSTESTSDDTMSGYAVLFTQSGTNLYYMTDVNVDNFHNVTEDKMEYLTGVSLINSASKDTSNKKHHILIDIVNNKLTVKDNDVLAFDGETLETIGNRFGPLVSYASHGCSQLSYFVFDGLKMGSSIKVVSKAQDNVGTVEWTEGAYKVYINLEDTNDTSLVVKDFTDALKADDANYIGVGLTASKIMHDAIIAANGKGTYFEFASYPQDLDTMANAIANYIWPFLEDPTVENIHNAILDSNVESDLETKPNVLIPGGVIDSFDDLVAGNNVEIQLDINLLPLVDVPSEDQTLVDAYLGGLASKDTTQFFYIGMTLIKLLNGEVDSKITSTLKPITIVLTLPTSIQLNSDFKIIRVHDGKVEVLKTTYDATNHTLTFTTDKFSTYAIQYNTQNLPDTGEAANAGMILLLSAALLMVLSRKTKIA